jgi:hypothetical protein
MSAEPGTKRGDKHALATLDNKLRLVDDHLRAVVHGYQTGLYLYGASGMGKSFNVIRTLEEVEADFRLFNSRMTAKGLFRVLQASPDSTHVLEDVERLTCDRDAQSVLRSALWAQPGRERQCTWTTDDGERRFEFRGGIVMLANRPLADLPELRALATRIAVHKLDVSDAEMAAHMRRIAGEGFRRGRHQLGPEHCLEVCEFLLRECRAANCPLDLRLFDNSCLDYLQWDASHSRCHWHDLVANRVRQSAHHFRHQLSGGTREERLQAEREVVKEVCRESESPQDRVRLWRERTGKSEDSFYRRKREADSGEFD